MKALSASTRMSDPYRAGVALGEALSPLSPEVVFLFSTVHYGGTSELLDGLYDTLERDDLVLVGNSGDGFFETQGVSEVGAAALALNSNGAVRWRVVSSEGVTADPAGATRACLKALDQALGGEKPAFMFLACDFRADGSRLEEVLRRETDVPVVGGFAADDNRMATCTLYANREVVRDGVVLLGAAGAIALDISVGNSLRPIGRPGRIDAAEGRRIQSIDGISAMAFIERETGKPVLQTDRGVVSLSILDPIHPAQKRLRSIVPDFSTDQGTLGLYGGIEPGKMVEVGLASADSLIDEVRIMAEKSRELPFEPQAALIVSCAGRKQVLGGAIENEVKALTQVYPVLPLAGYPSFGELGPLKDGDRYTPTMFHNMTYVLLLLGSPA